VGQTAKEQAGSVAQTVNERAASGTPTATGKMEETARN
jgi:hypothetical protein